MEQEEAGRIEDMEEERRRKGRERGGEQRRGGRTEQRRGGRRDRATYTEFQYRKLTSSQPLNLVLSVRWPFPPLLPSLSLPL
jgi:hypothetical protein